MGAMIYDLTIPETQAIRDSISSDVAKLGYAKPAADVSLATYVQDLVGSVIKKEILTDPTLRGYSGNDEAVIVDLLTSARQVQWRRTVFTVSSLITSESATSFDVNILPRPLAHEIKGKLLRFETDTKTEYLRGYVTSVIDHAQVATRERLDIAIADFPAQAGGDTFTIENAVPVRGRLAFLMKGIPYAPNTVTADQILGILV